MSKRLTRDQLSGLVEYYKSLIDQMQGHTFYCEDEEGVLRRWYPPKRPITDRDDGD